MRPLILCLGLLGLGSTGFGLVHVGTMRSRVLSEFELLSANSYYHVLAEPLRVRPGMDAHAAGIAARLSRAGLRHVHATPGPGEYESTLESIRFRAVPSEAGNPLVTLQLEASVVSQIEVAGEGADWADLPAEHLTSFRRSLHERRSPVDYADIPPPLVTAVLAAEDRRFFEHGGLDWRGIARAMLRDLAHRRVVEGGSTITQQAVKVILGRTDRQLPAKIDEALLALVVERRYSKQQILQVYLNNVYFGQEGPFQIYGVADGARFFFGKPLADLAPKEMVELAAAIRAPNAASPRRHRERLKEYTRAIAKAVPGVKLPAGAARAEDEAGEPLEDSTPAALEATSAERLDFGKAQLAYYFDVLDREWQAARQAQDFEPPATLVAGVDPVLQLRAAQAVQRGLAGFAPRRRRGATTDAGASPLQSAVVTLDPELGTLRAVVGGRDYLQAPFNRAADMQRQVGSTFKPIVYVAATGGDETPPRVTEASWLPDEPRQYRVGRTVWSPANFDGQFRSWVTVRQALEQSINAATVALGMDVGVERVARLAEKLGLQDEVPRNPSMFLGAVETSPIRLASVYAAFANQGRTVHPHALVEVRKDGRTWRPDSPPSRRVLSSEGCYIVTDMLVGAMRFGTGARAAQLGFTHLAAGKTGTSDKARDTWFVGFTPDLVTAVWVGYDDDRATGLTGASAALPIWCNVMSPWLGQGWDREFDLPPGITFRNIDPLTGGMANSSCPSVETAAFFQDTEPKEYCALHSPSLGDRFEHLFGPDEGQPPHGTWPQPQQQRGFWVRLKDALGV